MSLNASLKFLFTKSSPSKVFIIAGEICALKRRGGGGVEDVCLCVRRGCLSSALLGYTCLGQGWPLFFSKRTPLQMCGGSRVAAMYSKSASEGSSICGVERCGVVSPSHWYKRKFVLLSSHEAPGEVEVVVLQGKRRKGGYLEVRRPNCN